MAEHRRGLGLVDARFGGENQQFDVFAAGFFDDGQGRVGGEGHDVLVRRHDGHALLADADDEFVGIGAALLREHAQVEDVGGGVEGD